MSRRVLFVDDDDEVREAIGDILTFKGYDVAFACDGLEALDWLARHPRPLAILLDLRMPRCDGYEFRSRQLADARLAAIPVIVLSADAPHEPLDGVAAIGKPVDFAKLFKLLRDLAR